MKTANVSVPDQGNHRQNTMKAIVRTEYGGPNVLRLSEVNKPVVADNSVLVRVHAASVNAGDWHLLRGTPFLIRFIFGGVFKPNVQILGFDIAGQIEAVGKDVTQFQPGDQVFGDLSECGFGAFAEYVCAPESVLVLKPANSSFEVAAATPGAGLAALQGLRDVGRIQPGQQVLINGASGGVGSFAVQLAKAFGAEVTGVCSSSKIEMVRSLGADHVIDYTRTDVTLQQQRYDLILDAAAYRSMFDYRPILTPQGTYVMVGGSTARLFQVMFLEPFISRTNHKKAKCLVSKPNHADLTVLKELLEMGKITPYIDRSYDLGEVAAAIEYVEQRQVRGKVTIRI
jgi:NADPH:quinone reductase-like Zn-dependent oxidoreductase